VARLRKCPRDYLKLHCALSGTSVPAKKSKTSRIRRSVVLEDEEDDSGTTESHPNPLKPWLDEYQLYFNVR
jgi:hypothetical protein